MWGKSFRRGVPGVVILLAGGLTACGCDTPTGSCERVYGFVQVLVQDEEGAPIPDVKSCVALGLPSAWTCGFTQADGVAQVPPVREGMRRTWIEPPDGYVQGSEPLEQIVEVVRDQTTQVTFMLVRQ